MNRTIELSEDLAESTYNSFKSYLRGCFKGIKIITVLVSGWVLIRLSFLVYVQALAQYEKGWNWAKDYVLGEAMEEIGYEKIELGLNKQGALDMKYGKDLSQKELIIALTWNLNQLASCQGTAQAVAEMLNPEKINP